MTSTEEGLKVILGSSRFIDLLVFETWSLYPHSLIISMGLGHNNSSVELHIWPTEVGSKDI